MTFASLIDINFLFFIILDEIFLANSTQRLNQIHDLERKTIYLPQHEQNDAYRRLSELKMREIRFKEYSEQKNSDQMNADLQRRTINKR